MLEIKITRNPSTIQIGENKKEKITYFSYLNHYIKYGGTDKEDKVINLPEAYVVYMDGKLRWSKDILTAKNNHEGYRTAYKRLRRVYKISGIHTGTRTRHTRL